MPPCVHCRDAPHRHQSLQKPEDVFPLVVAESGALGLSFAYGATQPQSPLFVDGEVKEPPVLLVALL